MCDIDRFNHLADLMEALSGSLNVPPGHQFEFDREYAERWLVGHDEKYGSDMSVYILRRPWDESDLFQVRVEVRLFVGRPEATVWVRQGRPINFEAKSLFDNGQSAYFAHADTHEGLMPLIAERVNGALARARKDN